MIYSIKTNIPFVLVLLTAAMFGCQMQKQEQANGVLADPNMKNSPAVSTDSTSEFMIRTPTMTFSTDKALTDPYTKQQKHLLLQGDYEGALQLMPQVKEEFLAKAKDNKKEESAMLFAIRRLYCCLYMMLDREEDAYTTIKEMTLEPSGGVPVYFIYADNMAVLSWLNKIDEMAVEAHKILRVQDLPSYFEHVALNALIAAYLINNDNESALQTITHWKEKLLNTSPDFDEDLKRGFVHNMFIMEYFLEHLQDDYVAKFIVEKPEPPRVDPLDSEKIICRHRSSELHIVSRKDGTYLDADESIMKIIRERTVNFMQSSQQPPKSLYQRLQSRLGQ